MKDCETINGITRSYNKLLEEQIMFYKHASKIKAYALQGRRDGEDFLLRHDERDLAKVQKNIVDAEKEIQMMGDMAAKIGHTKLAGQANNLQSLMEKYKNNFTQAVQGWHKKGTRYSQNCF